MEAKNESESRDQNKKLPQISNQDVIDEESKEQRIGRAENDVTISGNIAEPDKRNI